MQFSRTAAGLLLLLGVHVGAWAQGPLRFVAGEHYAVLDKPLAPAEAGTVDVVEFFIYGCSHCYGLDEAVTEWAAGLPEYSYFRRIPVLFGSNGENYARLFYAAEELEVLDTLHSRIFDAIHEDKKKLTSLPVIASFMAGNSNVSKDVASQTLKSKAVDIRVAESAASMRAFRVTAVPSLGIGGKYWVTAQMAGSNQQMFEVADFLIRQEHASQ